MKIRFLLFFSFLNLLGTTHLALAQTAILTGTVTDVETGKALTGATVSVQGGRLGTVADSRGEFRLAVPDGSSATLAYGSPAVGGLYYLTLTFDGLTR